LLLLFLAFRGATTGNADTGLSAAATQRLLFLRTNDNRALTKYFLLLF
jgi:hypothetical protein